jgi:hypothetical protein
MSRTEKEKRLELKSKRREISNENRSESPARSE